MPRQVILLAVELHPRCRCCQSHPKVRRRSPHPSLHQQSHIHRHIRSLLAHRNRLHRAPPRWQRPIRHAVLPPRPNQRLYTHRPCRIHPVTVESKHRPRDLSCRRPHRQRRKIELQQPRIPRTHIQVRNRPAIHLGTRAVHMGIGHQRRLHGRRWQRCGKPGRQPNTKQNTSPYKAHPTPYGSGPGRVCGQGSSTVQRFDLYCARCRWPCFDHAMIWL